MWLLYLLMNKITENFTDKNIIMENTLSTVIAEYIPTPPPSQYQSEKDLEEQLIAILQNNGYEYLSIKSNDQLLANARKQISLLNNYNFSNNEWLNFEKSYLCNKGDNNAEKTKKIQEDERHSLILDDGSTKNIIILDKKNIHNNIVQVINQYATTGNYHNRYDVSILVNGLPLCHIELKRRGVAIAEAFNQIKRYQRDSFWSDSGLFQFVQLFIISNGTHTKYYSNTTRHNTKAFNSFEFTSWWTDAKNQKIADLHDFAKTFLSKHTLLSVITKYCIFTTQQALMVMRPYQIVASENIINRIAFAYNTPSLLGTVDAGGYIWHTTGSGKTLTSFKTAQLCTALPYVHKVLFVVDRKDLDAQTMAEYEKFKKDSANSNADTKILTEQLTNTDSKIIVTTIQKLDRFISSNKNHVIFNKHVVIIFDECHRSQFGSMHTKIIKSFKKYNIIGFTGTPIFTVNAQSNNVLLKTTEQAFGKQLHCYTIVDAIYDENVLKFRIDYNSTISKKDGIVDKKVSAIDTKQVLENSSRISSIVTYILENFNKKTYHKKFNSMFAVSSIEMAKAYYTEFAKQQASSISKLKVALIYSFGANDPEDSQTGLMADEDFDASKLDTTNRAFLDTVITDYNNEFNTNFDTSSTKFESYYHDLSKKVKDKQIDILIVVNMFLTGFDAKTLNTLWVDKNLYYHGLLQAFSRTNRILDSNKKYGNIVCFRNLEEHANEAIALFGNKNATSIIIARTYNEYYNGYDDEDSYKLGYVGLIEKLKNEFAYPVELMGEQQEKDFIKLFSNILRVKNLLDCFDEFQGNEILTAGDLQNYQSVYLDLHDKIYKTQDASKESIIDDIIFEIELLKQVTYDIDAILMLIESYQKSNMQNNEIVTNINSIVSSTINLRSKRQLIDSFINTITVDTDVTIQWKDFVNKNYEDDLTKIIEEEKLKPALAFDFMKESFRKGYIVDSGTALPEILPAISLFGDNGDRTTQKNKVIFKLQEFFNKYSGIH